LGSANPTGEMFGDSHPPYGCRVLLTSRVLRKQGWLTYPKSSDPALDSAIAKTDAFMTAAPSKDRWYDIFGDKQIDAAVDGLVKLLGTFPKAKAVYSPPSFAQLESIVDLLLRRVPPCGATLTAAGEPKLTALDFRHVLYAGWIVWNGRNDLPMKKKLDFFHINQLCDRGMLQDFAVELKQ
jgi:hypothetical protein